MPKVIDLKARWILDSRGLPTITCNLTLDLNGKKGFGKASVPSGASTGTYEALELRDNGKEFHGKGVDQAIENINTIISSQIFEIDFNSAEEVDIVLLNLDKTKNKSELGANAILAVSMAAYRAFADLYNLELWQYLRRLYFSFLPAKSLFPRLMCNVINGGAHADSGLAIQEFMVIPQTGDLESDVQLASEVYQTLKKNLAKDGQSTALGDEGGFAPKINNTKRALKYLQNAIIDSGYERLTCDLALDCAANEFYDAEKKVYTVDGEAYSASVLVDFYKEISEEYGIVSIEDGLNEDDILGWELMTEALGKKVKLIGDDLFVTNLERFKKIGLDNKIANGVLIKLNQIGTVKETCDIINKAKDNEYITAVSHRSGETNDDFISDLAFASQSEFIKLGAPARGERVAKYNRLLEIKEGLE